ncbi:MAG: O-antigen ligase family protein [Gemmatimonadota bacterium]|jgi:hypothetical protein
MTGGRGLRAALVALVTLPAVAVIVGVSDGRLLFIEYREPKLVAAVLLGTLFVALFVWTHGIRRASDALWTGLAESPELALFALLLGLMTLSGLWATVPENWWYELRQDSLFFAVAVLVRWWARREPPVAGLLAIALCGVAATLVLVGALQAAGLLPWLTTIDPGYGVGYPSLLGYKNPMALAVIGQLFLLPLAAEPLLRHARESVGRRLLLAGVAALFVVECVYVAFLKSRTSYIALGLGLVGAAGILALSARQARDRRSPWAARPALFGLVLAAGLGALALSFALNDGLRTRLISAKADYVDSWSRSDRATYLLNSLAMARHRPFGVGLGNWQTVYPVYRPYNPGVAFSETVQPRRAHDDHAQLLAELGWPGLALWCGFWIVLLWRRFRPAAGTDPLRSRLLGVQLAVWAVAMAGDFVLEHPYLKLLFFLILALPAGFAAGSDEPSEPGTDPVVRRPPANRVGRVDPIDRLIRPVLLFLVIVAAWEAWAWTARLHASGCLRAHSLGIAQARAAGRSLDEVWPEAQQALAAGDRVTHGHGFTKTLFRDYLVTAQLALLAGDPARAHGLTWASLRLHPYDSQAFRLLARIWAPIDPARSRMFERTARRILNGPAAGFDGVYPVRVPLPPGSS